MGLPCRSDDCLRLINTAFTQDGSVISAVIPQAVHVGGRKGYVHRLLEAGDVRSISSANAAIPATHQKFVDRLTLR
jgi:hypothetical protein